MNNLLFAAVLFAQAPMNHGRLYYDAAQHPATASSAPEAVVYEPKTHNAYRNYALPVRTTSYEDVKYTDTWRNVLVINGVVPEVTIRYEVNGDTHNTFDYRKGISFKMLKDKDKRVRHFGKEVR